MQYTRWRPCDPDRGHRGNISTIPFGRRILCFLYIGFRICFHNVSHRLCVTGPCQLSGTLILGETIFTRPILKGGQCANDSDFDRETLGSPRLLTSDLYEKGNLHGTRYPADQIVNKKVACRSDSKEYYTVLASWGDVDERAFVR